MDVVYAGDAADVVSSMTNVLNGSALAPAEPMSSLVHISSAHVPPLDRGIQPADIAFAISIMHF